MEITFKNILDVSTFLQMQVREWRNLPEVKKYMYTDKEISEDEHKKWLNSLSLSNYNKVFVIFYNDSALGIVSVNNISFLHKSCDWAFYIYNESLRGKGIGVIVEYKLLNYVFDELKFEKLNCEVLEINPAVIKFHKKFGFREEGIRRKNVIKENKRLDVYYLGLLSEEWKENKSKIEKIIIKMK